LAKVHLRRGGQDHGVGALDAFAKITGEMRNSVFLGDFRGRILVAADERRDFDLGDALERIQMLLAESTLASDANLHHQPLRTSRWGGGAGCLSLPCLPALRLFSRMMWPTAVLEAGTV